LIALIINAHHSAWIAAADACSLQTCIRFGRTLIRKTSLLQDRSDDRRGQASADNNALFTHALFTQCCSRTEISAPLWRRDHVAATSS